MSYSCITSWRLDEGYSTADEQPPVSERVESFNFLGLIIDEGLSWKKHTDVVKNKISKVVGILYRLKNIFPKNILQTL